jgi:hypothetical protein
MVGPLDVAELRGKWKAAARSEVRKQLREKKESATLVTPTMLNVPKGSEMFLDLGRP